MKRLFKRSARFYKRFVKFLQKLPIPKIPKAAFLFFQLSLLYSYAFIDLFYNIVAQVNIIEYRSAFFEAILPLSTAILDSKYLIPLFSSPEKMYVLSYFTIELIIVRSMFGIDPVVKFHILFVLIYQILQGYVFLLWDLLFNRQISKEVTPWMFDDSLFELNVNVAGFLFTITFFVSCIVYLLAYIQGLQGRFVHLGKSFHWITDSAGWVIRFRRQRKKNRDF
jgi:hypothetical protein